MGVEHESSTVVVFFLGRACFLKGLIHGGGAYETPHLCVPSRGNTEQTSLCRLSKQFQKDRVSFRACLERPR